MLKRNSFSILSAAKNLILFSIFFGFTLYSQPFTQEEKEILQIQDKRNSLELETIEKYLADPLSKEYYRAILAAASMQDSALVKTIGEMLNSNSISYHLTGWLLGNFNTEESIKYLIERITPGKRNNNSAILSLGRIGDEKILDVILSHLPFDRKSAMALAFLGIRKIKSENTFSKLNELLSEVSLDKFDNEYTVSYAFYRIGDKQYLAPYKEQLTSLTKTKSTNKFTLMWAYSALGKLQDTVNIPYFLESLEKEIDWRVRVNICNSLGNQLLDLNSPLTDKIVTALLEHTVHDQNAHVSIVALQALGKLFAGADIRNPQVRKIQQEIQFILTPGKAIDWQIKAEAIRTYAKIFRDEAKDELFSIFNKTDNYDIKSAIVGSFGFMDNPLVYKELRDSISADVQRYNVLHPNKDGSMIGSDELAKLYRAFVDALKSLDDKLDAENKNIIRLILSEFSSSKDPVLTDNCLTNLQDTMYLQYRNETCQIMTFDYNTLVLPKDRDVALMYIQAWDNMKYDGAKEILTANLKSSDYDIAIASAKTLKNITGKNYEKEITAIRYRTDFDWSFIDKLGEKKIANIVTNKGIIKIVLLSEDAPFTVQNFVKLSEKGYYNNTIFHRVVPNFVIQGGDPTGTGYGGPGYSIRSEFSPLSFGAYSVGMASSGKDTEGSQFFITHSPQPHLDGKYTLFGEVVEGFDVVDNIQIGDVIESVTFSSLK